MLVCLTLQWFLFDIPCRYKSFGSTGHVLSEEQDQGQQTLTFATCQPVKPEPSSCRLSFRFFHPSQLYKHLESSGNFYPGREREMGSPTGKPAEKLLAMMTV